MKIIAKTLAIMSILLLLLTGCDGNNNETSSGNGNSNETSSSDGNSNETSSSEAPQESSSDLASVQVGDTITFGTYEQDIVTSNGKEEIEWEVLDVQEGKALIISKYGLDAKPYNETYTDITWETCTLRTWLNNDFYNTAFSSSDKSRIQSTTLTNADNSYYGTDGGNDTTDKVFLLSIGEAVKYYASDKVGEEWTSNYKDTNGAASCEATEYAKSNGAWVSPLYGTSWWLRSPGHYQNGAAYVHDFGDVYAYGSRVDYAILVVRPALWISLES